MGSTDLTLPGAKMAENTPAQPEPSTSRAVTVIRPRPGWVPINLAELWRYRELLWFFALRDIKVRYKQTLLGAGWAVLQPVATMIVFTLLFHGVAGIGSDGKTPYPVFIYVALLPWQLFANALQFVGNSLVNSDRLITKVYFPRLIVPVSSMASGLVDFAISFGVLVVLMAWYGLTPTIHVLALPLLVLFALAAAMAVGLWLAALNVQFRDVRYTIPFLTQIWFFATPVAYPVSKVPEQWQMVFGLNPMVGVVEGFRWALIGGNAPTATMWASVCAVIFLLIGGLYYFRRMEKNFADVL